MSGWAPAFDALSDIDARREQAVEVERQRRLERARRLAGNGHLNPIQVPLVAVAATQHHYSPLPVSHSSGIDGIQPGCSCGWKSRRTFYVERFAKGAWRRHMGKAAK